MTPARPRRHAAARGAAALAVLVVALAARVAPTVADTPTNDPTSTTSTTTGGAGTASTPSITLVSQSAWVGPTGVFEMRVRGPLPVSGQIDARVYVPISTQDQLATTSAGDQLGALVEHVAVPAAQVVRAADGSFLLRYPLVTGGSVPTYGLHLSNPGVYPFELRIEDIDGTVVGDLVTQLIRLPDEQSGIPALSVALVVPYGAPVSRSPDSSPHLTPSTLAALRAESVALARAPGVPVAVAPVPETIDTLAQIDRTSGTHGVAQLATAIRGRTLVSGTYVTVDSGAWLADGLADGYERQLAVGRAVLDAGLQSSPSRTVSTTDATTTPDVLAVAFDHGTREVVVSSSRLAEDGPGTGTPSGPLTQWFDLASSNGERIQAVPADAKLDAQLVEGPDQVLSAHHVLAALALVALDRSDPQACVRPSGEACRRGVGIQLPGDAHRALPALRVLLAALDDPTAAGGRSVAARSGIAPISASALVEPVSVPGFLAAVDPASESGTTSATDAHELRHLDEARNRDLGAYPERFQEVSQATDAFASMVTPTDSKIGLALATTWTKLVLASGAVGTSRAAAAHQLEQVDSAVHGQTSQITAPSQQTVTLTSAAGKIPFSISNPLPYPVQVQLVLQSPKLHFVDGPRQLVTLPAGQPRHLQIAVTARASGAFPMQVTITSPDSRLTITHTQFDVRSTAVSGIGLVLTIAAGAFLLLWWARHYRDARRRRGLVESAHPALRADRAPDQDHYAAPTE